MMTNLRLLWYIVKKCHFEKFLLGFVIAFFVSALIIQAVEPGISTYADALWYTFVACTSIGFGDITALTFVGRILTVFIVLYEILLVSLFSGVIVSHYLEVIHRQEQYTATVLLDKLMHLTELSRGELQDIEEKAKEFDRRTPERTSPDNKTGSKR